MISSCCAEPSFSPCSRSRTNKGKFGISVSGIAYPRDLVERVKKCSPLFPQRIEFLFSGGSQRVVAPIAAFTVVFPLSFDPAALFQFIEHGIKRGQREPQRSFGPLLNGFCDFKPI